MRPLVSTVCLVLFVSAMTVSSAFAQGTITHQSAVRLADAHEDACVYNYNQCMNGCDGAQSCEGQCQTNYDGCMAQGQ
jgi:hypothetical protein